jgi:succinate-semialdehyde dehydrogenase / glutarate-semialdehyde dehydrogenase
MVLKPAEQTPLSALAVAVLAEEAGFPAGVLSILTGDADDAPAIGAEMTSSPLVSKVAFTGSNEVGKLLMAQCAKGLKKIALELGGNAPFIVFDDADLDEAVAGDAAEQVPELRQTCITANRILVQEAIYDDYLERLVAGVTRLKVGAGVEPEVKVGPLIDEPALAKVERHVADAVDGGAELHLGGERHDLGRTFFQPTVLTGIMPRWRSVSRRPSARSPRSRASPRR